ncbi:UNVERIFIED_CONTAM: hypothetical protein Sindi_2652500 [Sesamum indicum]
MAQPFLGFLEPETSPSEISPEADIFPASVHCQGVVRGEDDLSTDKIAFLQPLGISSKLGVIDGDETAMNALKNLQICWETKFGKCSSKPEVAPVKLPPPRRCLLPGHRHYKAGKQTEEKEQFTVLADSRSSPEKSQIPAINPTTRSSSPTTSVLPVGDATADVEREMGYAAADLVEYTDDIINEVSPDDVIHNVSPDDVLHDVSPDDVTHDISPNDVIHDVSPDDVSHDVSPDVVRCDVINVVKNCRIFPKQSSPIPTGLFVGNIPLHTCPNAIDDDKIAHAFNNSSRKTLSFIAPTIQNGEIVVRPSLDTVRDGSKRWKTTAVGYFLGKKPYYHHLKEYAHSVWPALREVTVTASGFFFFQFKTLIDMEDVIEGGPWLFQG